MIEAVNSSLVSAQALRGNAGNSSASRAVVDVAPPVAVSEAPEAPKAPYISPYISIDANSNKAVLQIRDPDTGDVKQQFPTKSRLAQLSQLQARQENAQRVEKTPVAMSSNAEVSSYSSDYEGQASDIITVQDITSSQPSNISLPAPQIAAAALSAGAQSGQSSPSVNVSVLA